MGDNVPRGTLVPGLSGDNVPRGTFENGSRAGAGVFHVEHLCNQRVICFRRDVPRGTSAGRARACARVFHVEHQYNQVVMILITMCKIICKNRLLNKLVVNPIVKITKNQLVIRRVR